MFTYHKPFGDQPQRYEALRGMGLALGKLITQSTPPSREQSLALTFLQQTIQMSNAAIAINEVEHVDLPITGGAELLTPMQAPEAAA